MLTQRSSARPFRFIGRGVYSVPEASRLTGIPPKRIRRWAQGYEWGPFGRTRYSIPVIANEISAHLGETALDFADLVEIRFLDAFLQYGVSWKSIRIASQRAKELLGLSYPFSSKKFATDGHTILAQFVTDVGDAMLIDLVRNQYELQKLIDTYLIGQIDWDERDHPTRWWPLQGSRRIVIDPQRAFGAPIVAAEGVPTRVLASAFQTEKSIDLVAAYFSVDPAAVQDAIRYETLRDAA